MTPGLCECGCGKPTAISTKTCRRDGRLTGHPMRFVRGHNPVQATPWHERVIETTRGCLVWQGCLNSKGYGCISNGAGKVVLAHRFVWQQQHGPIPDGLTIDHRCEEKRCLNTAHMELVTRAENTRRRWRRPSPLEVAA